MLTIQPKVTSAYPQRISFKSNEEDASTFRKQAEELKQEMADVIPEEKMPKKIKSVFNWIDMIAGALISGGAVAWATIRTGSFGKTIHGKLSSNSIVKSALDSFKPIGEYAGKFVKFIEKQAGKLVRKLFGEEKGQKIVDWSKSIIKSTKDFFARINPFKSEETYNKAVSTTSTVLGAGAAGATLVADIASNAEQKEEAKRKEEEEEEERLALEAQAAEEGGEE